MRQRYAAEASTGEVKSWLSPEVQPACEAFRAVGFTVPDDDEQDEYVSVTKRPHGRESLLPSAQFRPVLYHIGKSMLAAAHEEWDRWFDAHVRAVLEVQTGATRLHNTFLFESMAMQELVAHSRVVVTAAQINPEEAENGVTHIAVWGDGSTYRTAWRAEAAWSSSVISARRPAKGRVFARSAIGHGLPTPQSRATIACGYMRTVISREGSEITFDHNRADAEIVGNVIALRLPFKQSVPK